MCSPLCCTHSPLEQLTLSEYSRPRSDEQTHRSVSNIDALSVVHQALRANGNEVISSEVVVPSPAQTIAFLRLQIFLPTFDPSRSVRW